MFFNKIKIIFAMIGFLLLSNLQANALSFMPCPPENRVECEAEQKRIAQEWYEEQRRRQEEWRREVGNPQTGTSVDTPFAGLAIMIAFCLYASRRLRKS